MPMPDLAAKLTPNPIDIRVLMLVIAESAPKDDGDRQLTDLPADLLRIGGV
jgi:hypothetical protein